MLQQTKVQIKDKYVKFLWDILYIVEENGGEGNTLLSSCRVLL